MPHNWKVILIIAVCEIVVMACILTFALGGDR
jgi:hypothetical protein